MKQWYEELFEEYALKYDNEVFTKGNIEDFETPVVIVNNS